MKFRDFFDDFKKGELKDEFKHERKEEFWQWIRENKTRDPKNIMSSSEAAQQIIERNVRLQRLRKRKQEREAQASANNPGNGAL